MLKKNTWMDEYRKRQTDRWTEKHSDRCIEDKWKDGQFVRLSVCAQTV